MAAAMQRRKLLILENDRALRRELEAVFSDLDVTVCESSDQTLATVRRTEPDVVLFDLGTAHKPAVAAQSLELLRQILNISPDTKIIAMTEHDARELAVAAVGLGAADFYHKPLDAGVLSIVVRRALRIRELEEENWRLRERTGAMALEGIIGVSDAVRSLCRSVEKVAPTNTTVLLLGESGTGKELLARALHRLSGRSHKPFVAINCAAIPDTLLESELFGYEKGAFTGAARRTPGKLESADGGTVFLDEIGEMPASLQAKLLRVVQERSVERIGGRTLVSLDLRIVCATNRALDALIGNGGFRDDLFYRISEVIIRVPPLRDRQGDSLLLAQFLLQQISARLGKPTRGLAPDAIRAIQAHRWPGNVRELENRVKGAVIMAEGVVVTAGDLGLEDPGDDPEYLNLRVARQCAEAQAVRQSLAVAQGNLSRAAELLGVTRPTLYDLLDKHSIDPAQFGRQGARATAEAAEGGENPAKTPVAQSE
ncbi:MAG: PEP-CTERM-box response regulator transcription factor [Gammaproteobacteria bacterium]|nr:PEP-CTERM-box response regulator transcription factor [Gammaproteobacteria bacterium]MBV9724567.1 PEP-CTERM-box response regulator transcription factor [Gammaproteobacteria bacterium]